MRLTPRIVLVVLMALSGAAPAQPPVSNTWVFTQVHQGQDQPPVPVGADLEIQLPGEPTIWSLRSISQPTLESAGPPDLVPSPGRIAGTNGIYVFRFKVKTAGTSTITLEEIHPSAGTVIRTFELTITSQ